MAKCDTNDSGWALCPNLAAAALFTALYGCCFLLHLYLTIKTRKKFCWVITTGSAWLTLGFGLRTKAAISISGLGDFIPQSIIIFLGPLWLNGFVYMVLGRMVHMLLVRDKVYKISARRLTFIFVCLDIVAFFVQASASGPMSDDDRDVSMTGVDIMMAGVGLQQAFISFFIVLAIRFHHKLHVGVQSHHPNIHASDPSDSTAVKPIIYTLPWLRLLIALYVTLALITIRNIFRLIEFSDGVEGYIAVNEAFFYCLDALPIFVGLVVMAVVHPSRVLKGPESEFLRREGKRWCWGRGKRERKSKSKKGRVEGGVSEV